MSTIVITGASDGIGAAAAEQIHTALPDARLVLVGRDPDKTRAVAGPLGAEHHTADFTRLDEVRDLASALDSSCERIDVLANNAGGSFRGPIRTGDGFEQTWQVNHLAPYLLTNLLIDKLLVSRASVVATSSAASWAFSRLNPDDPNSFHDFNPNRAYANAKLANVLFTRALHDRYHPAGLNTVAFHPGLIATNFASNTSSMLRFVYQTPAARLITQADRGGANLAHFITGVPGIHWESGRYYNKRRRPGHERPQAKDRDLINRIFDDSAAALGVSWP
ncbi:SDR family NAD(P)-dependent oxidoreductase [Corynebacterium halotolerans]|uniref:SDR family NAD(P)-dependent oxidoreductase n=1 Tax=Corynebacterium halotolerans TaxID=225326 RepID=UPI000B21B4AA|nr:SDR family NAD(P)-dependent oxidoreductase [Corynebacterium halotolerans]